MFVNDILSIFLLRTTINHRKSLDDTLLIGLVTFQLRICNKHFYFFYAPLVALKGKISEGFPIPTEFCPKPQDNKIDLIDAQRKIQVRVMKKPPQLAGAHGMTICNVDRVRNNAS